MGLLIGAHVLLWHEEERIKKKVWSFQDSLDSGGPIHDKGESPGARPRSDPTYMWSPGRCSHRSSSPMLAPDSRGVGPVGLPGWPTGELIVNSKFICNSGEKCLQTIWDEQPLEIEGLQYLDITKDAIWNAARNREMERTLTREESKRVQEGLTRETVT
jgi:hypothetical protein